jgi:hypothetical protein
VDKNDFDALSSTYEIYFGKNPAFANIVYPKIIKKLDDDLLLEYYLENNPSDYLFSCYLTLLAL